MCFAPAPEVPPVAASIPKKKSKPAEDRQASLF
jgi:hypothetical protein